MLAPSRGSLNSIRVNEAQDLPIPDIYSSSSSSSIRGGDLGTRIEAQELPIPDIFSLSSIGLQSSPGLLSIGAAQAELTGFNSPAFLEKNKDAKVIRFYSYFVFFSLKKKKK